MNVKEEFLDRGSFVVGTGCSKKVLGGLLDVG
jgi:hypothetical protein